MVSTKSPSIALREPQFQRLLTENDLCIIDNPLIYRSPEELRTDVETFFQAHQLGSILDEELLQRGARLAQDEVRFLASGDASQVERTALQREKDPSIRDHSRNLNVILLTCCIAAMKNGWSQSSITGANLQWPYSLGVQSDYRNPDTIMSFWIFGLVQAITYFSAGTLGAFASDPLNQAFGGRRGALFIAGVFTFAAAIGSAFTYSWQSLCVCRLVLGIGYGAEASVTPIYESEVSPAASRGRLLVSWQTFTAVGIALGSAFNLVFHGPHIASPLEPDGSLAVAYGDSWRQNVAWRLQVAGCAIPAIPLLCLAFLCSESPRWLARKNRYADAYASLQGLRSTPLQAARDLYYIYAQLRVETLLFSKNPDIEEELGDWSRNRLYSSEAKASSYGRRLAQLFTVKRNRRSSLAACIVMAAQQLCGINIFAFVATTVFSSASSDPMKTLWLSFGFSLSNAIFSPLAWFYVDSKGRRFLLLASLIAMVPLLLATAFSFKIDASDARLGVIEFFVILYTAAYSPGAGVVPFLYSSEVSPLINREASMSLSCCVNFVLAGVLALTVPQLNHAIGPTRMIGMFAGLDAAAAILVWLFVPGTAQVTTLEEMNYIFGVPTRRHVRYQVFKVLPWAIKRIVPGIVAGHLNTLYTWNRWRGQADLRPVDARLSGDMLRRGSVETNDVGGPHGNDGFNRSDN